MSSSKVYFTNLRAKPSQNLFKKLDALIIKAGIDQIDFKRKIVAVKLHFGEPGNLAYLRPNFAARIVKFLKAKEAIPFLTDCNTLYFGRRSNAPMHLEAAFENGYNPLTTNCPVIIGDGIKGTDYREIELNLEYSKTAKIGSASVGGKLFLHSGSSPEIFEANCTGCRVCEKYCAHDAVAVGKDKIAHIDYVKCVGCGQCVAVCQYDSARVVWQNSSETVCKRIAEYTLAVIKDKPSFHINFIMNVSPDCDCWGFNDYPLVPDLGMAASFDPVALDQACADMVTAAPALPGSRICDNNHENDMAGDDKFKLAHLDTFWQAGLEHAVKIGLGNTDYELISI